MFVHPTVPGCCQTLLPAVTPLIAEVPQDTTRAIANLLFTGSFSRFKDIRFIFTHAGGTMPMVAGRMQQYGRGPLGTKDRATKRSTSASPPRYEPRLNLKQRAEALRLGFCPGVTAGDYQ